MAPADPSLSALLVLGAMNFVPRWYQPEGAATVPVIASFYSEVLLRALGGKV